MPMSKELGARIDWSDTHIKIIGRELIGRSDAYMTKSGRRKLIGGSNTCIP